MTDAEMDVMLATCEVVSKRSYVPALVAEVRRLNAENERLSLALSLAQELADGYKAGIYGDPEPRGMSDAGLNAYHATLSLRRTCERQQKELADAAKDKTWLEDEARRLESALREGR